MYKFIFERIDNIEVAPVISLIIFFVFFILLLLWVFKADKSYIEKMKNLPIDGNGTLSTEHNDTYHEK